MRQTVYILIGVPGSGKSTWAKAKAQSTPDTYIVCRDDLRQMVHGRYLFLNSVEPLIFEMSRELIRQVLQFGHDLIVDETHMTKTLRLALISMIKQYSVMVPEIAYVVFNQRPNCLERRMTDARGTPEETWREVIAKMAAAYEAPTPDEGYSKLVVVE